MDDSVKKYQERRDARIKARKARIDDQWITMRGTHVLIDDGGQVSKGPEKLKGVVKQGGGYKSRAERKYGSNDKFNKFMNNGWNTSSKNVPPTEAKSTKPARAHISEETKKALEEYEKTPRGAASKAEFQRWAERKKAPQEKPDEKSKNRNVPSGEAKKMEPARVKLPESTKKALEEYEKTPQGAASKAEYQKFKEKNESGIVKGGDPSQHYYYGSKSASGKKDFPMGRSKMRSSGKFTKKELQNEVKKLIDQKGGINKLTGGDFEEARKKLGASWEEWNNAWQYWNVGPGSKKL